MVDACMSRDDPRNYYVVKAFSGTTVTYMEDFMDLLYEIHQTKLYLISRHERFKGRLLPYHAIKCDLSSTDFDHSSRVLMNTAELILLS